MLIMTPAAIGAACQAFIRQSTKDLIAIERSCRQLDAAFVRARKGNQTGKMRRPTKKGKKRGRQK